MNPPYFTYTELEPRIVIGSIPHTPADFAQLEQHGIDAILTLTRRDPQSYPDMPIWSDIAWHHGPIPDGSITDDKSMLESVAFVDAMYKAGKTVYVHCRGGIGRSGTILIAYYVLHRGMTVEQARNMVRPRRNYEGNACAADQGSPQREWIDALESKK